MAGPGDNERHSDSGGKHESRGAFVRIETSGFESLLWNIDNTVIVMVSALHQTGVGGFAGKHRFLDFGSGLQ